MVVNDINILSEHIESLAGELSKPFPYDDCRKVLNEAEAAPKHTRRYHDLIPDLSTYFSDIYSHASGVEFLKEWPSDRISQSQAFLKRSFFDAYSAYKSIEWRINEIDTPTLYRDIVVNNQLRNLLLELFSQLLYERVQINEARQKQLLSVI